MIRARYPDAAFEAFPNDDPPGIYVRITVDIDEPGDVIDAILPRLVEMQLDGLPIYPVAVRPLERVVAELDARSKPASAGSANGMP